MDTLNGEASISICPEITPIPCVRARRAESSRTRGDPHQLAREPRLRGPEGYILSAGCELQYWDTLLDAERLEFVSQARIRSPFGSYMGSRETSAAKHSPAISISYEEESRAASLSSLHGT